jgi:hypothetical protein
MSQVSSRLHFIDSVRGLAVIMAMLSHALFQFSNDFIFLKPLTRTATPVFVILFGIMLEIAYLRRIRTGTESVRVETRLLSRMITCYVLFTAITLAAFLSGRLNLWPTMKALLFLDDGYFGVILKIYTVLFFIVVLLFPWIRRHGAVVFLQLAFVAWTLKLLLEIYFPESPYVVTFIVGNAEGFGPAILPSMTFLAFGMAFGEWLSGRRGPLLWSLLLALAVVVSTFALSDLGTLADIRDTWVASRWSNRPVYFAIGICSTSLFLLIFWLTWRREQADPVSRFTEVTGRQTLFVYSAGNIVLNLLPRYSGQDPVVASALVMIFMALLLGIAWIRSVRPDWLNRLGMGIPSTVSQAYDLAVDRCAVTIRKVLRVDSGTAG